MASPRRWLYGSLMRTVIGAILAASLAASAASAAADAATADALGWVKLIDSGRYAESWAGTGGLFRASVTQDAWAQKVAAVRKPLGAVTRRTFANKQEATSLPGAPDGHYEILQFNTVFANKAAAVETVVLSHEPGGWRVDGYFIR